MKNKLSIYLIKEQVTDINSIFKNQIELYNYADLRNFKNNTKELNFNLYIKNFDLNCTINDKYHCFGIDNGFEKIVQKLSENQTINDICDTVSQGIITGGNPIYIFDSEQKINDSNVDRELLKPILRGENISKYYYAYENSKILYVNKNTNIDNYSRTLEYLEQFKDKLSQKRETKKGTLPYWSLWWARTEDLFVGEKILLRQTGDKLIAAYDNENYFAINSLLILRLVNYSDYKYVLALLNSKLLQYYYSNIAQEDGRAFAEVKPANIKRLPIPNTTFAQKQNLKLQSEQMIKLNKQFHEEIDSALELIKSEYQPKKISQNLEKFYTLGIHPFLEELEKQKVKLSLNQKEELIKWYQDKSKVLDDIKKQIDTLDQQIDQEVYKLYNLTDEEIKIIEEG